VEAVLWIGASLIGLAIFIAFVAFLPKPKEG
jgi:hypothetical protein